MKNKFFIILVFLLLVNLILPTINAINLTETGANYTFSFVHITDPHILCQSNNSNNSRKNELKSVLDYVISFEPKPSFIVLTGDLVAVGSGLAGALNYKEFLSCFYEKNNQIFASSDYTIPVYTCPGNHDYRYKKTIDNYHKYISNKDKYVLIYGNLCLIFLDSGYDVTLDPMPLGSGLSDSDILWLEEKLTQYSNYDKIILLHHPIFNWGNNGVISQNRLKFVELCDTFNVEFVLSGHTHSDEIMNKNKNYGFVCPINCDEYDTLYVQTESTFQYLGYRNISIKNGEIWIEHGRRAPEKPVKNVENINPTMSLLTKTMDKLLNLQLFLREKNH